MKTLWFWNKNKYFGEKKGKEKRILINGPIIDSHICGQLISYKDPKEIQWRKQSPKKKSIFAKK